MTEFKYLLNVVTLKLDQEKCNGCAMCTKVCPHAVFMRSADKKLVSIDRRDACMECGACSKNCPENAISVEAGVGCAAAVINSMLGRTDAPCCGPDTKGCC